MAAMQVTPRDVLLVIDVQNDFCPGGALAVPRGNEVVPVINGLIERFGHVVLTQDWHPARHGSLATSHGSAVPFSQIAMPYGRQTLWPDHCVQGTPGAQFHRGLRWDKAELVIRKGFRKEIDSYSAFFENDRATPTGLTGYLRERGFTRVVCVGLAFDYCVRYSAADAQAQRFGTVVVEDACRAIDTGGTAAATRDSLAGHGIALITSSDIA